MAAKKRLKLDKYARDASLWKKLAGIAYAAAIELFETRNLLLIFPAATLGHHSLEMYLKAALIGEGYGCTTVWFYCEIESPLDETSNPRSGSPI